MVQFLDPETTEILPFLDPEIVKIDKKIYGSRNRRNGAISGSRNRRKGPQILYLFPICTNVTRKWFNIYQIVKNCSKLYTNLQPRDPVVRLVIFYSKLLLRELLAKKKDFLWGPSLAPFKGKHLEQMLNP